MLFKARRVVRYISNSSLTPEHSSQWNVVHTNQWPIPYYKRQSWYPSTYYPENDYNVDIAVGGHAEVDFVNAYQARKILAKSMWGREVLDSADKQGVPYLSVIKNPKDQAEVYIEDLLGHIGFTVQENKRILKEVDLSSVFA